MIERASLNTYQLENIARNLDDNYNGKLGIYELGAPEFEWRRLDRDRDGDVSTNEFVRALDYDRVQLSVQGSYSSARKIAEALDENRDGNISDREVLFSGYFERGIEGSDNTDGRISVRDMADAFERGKVTLGRELEVRDSDSYPSYNPLPPVPHYPTYHPPVIVHPPHYPVNPHPPVIVHPHHPPINPHPPVIVHPQNNHHPRPPKIRIRI